MDEDAAFMREHTEALVSSYRKLQEVLAPVLGKERVRNASGTPAEKPAISPEQLADARVTIRECLNYYDYHSVGLVLDSLSEYALPPEEEKRMKELRAALDRIDRDALFRLLEGVM